MFKLRTMIAICGFVLVAVTAAIIPGRLQSQTAEYSYPPLSSQKYEYYRQHPEEFEQLRRSLPPVSHTIVPGKQLEPGEAPVGGTWTSLAHPLIGVNLSNPILLTDGTVIAHVSCASNWYKFSPDVNGSYINGTWTAIASTVSGYGPRFFGSGVLRTAA
jgi:hypothetical protein